jgi:hypothetical protein
LLTATFGYLGVQVLRMSVADWAAYEAIPASTEPVALMVSG